jgi:hypothetical protein
MRSGSPSGSIADTRRASAPNTARRGARARRASRARAQPLGLASLFDLEALLGLQALGALAQRVHDLALRAHEEAPADDHGVRSAPMISCTRKLAALDAAGLLVRAADGGGLLVDARPEDVGRAALAGGVALSRLGPSESAGLEQLFFHLTAGDQAAAGAELLEAVA